MSLSSCCFCSIAFKNFKVNKAVYRVQIYLLSYFLSLHGLFFFMLLHSLFKNFNLLFSNYFSLLMSIFIFFFFTLLTIKHIFSHSVPVQRFSGSGPGFLLAWCHSLTAWAKALKGQTPCLHQPNRIEQLPTDNTQKTARETVASVQGGSEKKFLLLFCASVGSFYDSA